MNSAQYVVQMCSGTGQKLHKNRVNTCSGYLFPLPSSKRALALLRGANKRPFLYGVQVFARPSSRRHDRVRVADDAEPNWALRFGASQRRALLELPEVPRAPIHYHQ